MTALRPLEIIAYAERPLPRPASQLRKPVFRWIETERLVIDPRYQREIGDRGRANIRRMIENFDWALFGVVTVTEAGENRYAVIDGQHRATAAHMHPAIPKVPCVIVEATEADQARTFIGINSAVVAMSPIQMFHAAETAGIADAAGAAVCAAAAGVIVMKYPVKRDQMKKGATLAAGTLRACWKTHGPKPLTAALKALAARDRDGLGLVNAHTIKALCQALASRHVSPALMDALEQIDFETVEDACQLAALQEGGGVAAHFAAEIAALLDAKGFAEKSPVMRKPKRGTGSY